MRRARFGPFGVASLGVASLVGLAATGGCGRFAGEDPADAGAEASLVDGATVDGAPPGVDGSPGDAGSHDADGDAGTKKLVVFVTVSSYSDVTTSAAADVKCAAEAAGRLPGKFVAWFPETGIPREPAVTRLVDSMGKPVDGPWFRPDGARVAASREALTLTAAVPLENPISINAAGTLATGNAWTGMRADGGIGTLCPDSNPTKGLVSATGPDWTETSVFTATCGSSFGLYCFQVE